MRAIAPAARGRLPVDCAAAPRARKHANLRRSSSFNTRRSCQSSAFSPTSFVGEKVPKADEGVLDRINKTSSSTHSMVSCCLCRDARTLKPPLIRPSATFSPAERRGGEGARCARSVSSRSNSTATARNKDNAAKPQSTDNRQRAAGAKTDNRQRAGGAI
ncbi:MAG: hypothetical protein QOK37_2164 [Thermoanaerobaculia bacterium]|jgi:hypothetical protein|nr:hypothetical protein [Thermoanaerobaculia bacterium]